MTVVAPLALLFPGQGAQRPGMLARLQAHAVTAAVADEAEAVLGQALSDIDSASALAGTRAAQLALLISGVANARLLEHAGVLPDYVAGHSVGAYAAATHARVFSFADALRLVALRGQLMAQAYPHGYGMAAIGGAPERQVAAWVAAANARGAALHLANRNAPTQVTVSGPQADLLALVEQARQSGARSASLLAVAVPSHSPLLGDVAARMLQALQTTRHAEPRMPYLANTSARLLAQAGAILDDLAQGVALPVRWHDMTIALYERGVRRFIEVPPGDTLTRLVQAALPDVVALALERVGVDGVTGMRGG